MDDPLANWAYKAAVAVEDWKQASWRAYDAARTLYTLERLTECDQWTKRMDKALSHIDEQSAQEKIRAALYQMEGLIARDLQGDRVQAYDSLHKALAISEEIGDDERVVLLLAQLGKLQELEGQIDDAISLYKKALEHTSKVENYDVQLDCYHKLARLALAMGDYDNAYNWCRQQLELSEKVSRVFYQARAHEGLGWVFLKKNKYSEAYGHARQALAIEEQSVGPRVEAMRNLVIKVSDKAMGAVISGS